MPTRITSPPNTDPQRLPGAPARHLFLCGLHGAVDMALATLNVIFGHHLLRRFHFLRSCRPRLTLAHGLDVSLHGVNGRLVTFDVMTFVAESQGQRKSC